MSGRRTVDLALLALLAAAAGAVAADLPVLRPLLVLGAMLLVPGAAVLTRLRVPDALSGVALAIGLSLALDALLAAALAAVGLWDPLVAGAVVAGAAALVLAADLRAVA